MGPWYKAQLNPSVSPHPFKVLFRFPQSYTSFLSSHLHSLPLHHLKMYSTAFFTALIAATTAIAIPVGSNDNVFSAVVNKRSLDARRHGTIQGSKPLRPAPATGAASGTGAQGKHTWSGTHG